MPSAHKSPLHGRVYERLREAFGEPYSRGETDHHWSMWPGHQMASINIVLNGAGHSPAVWIFDPYDRAEGVLHTTISDEDQIEEIVQRVTARLQQAAEKVQGAR